jgi:hypothetical protein
MQEVKRHVVGMLPNSRKMDENGRERLRLLLLLLLLLAPQYRTNNPPAKVYEQLLCLTDEVLELEYNVLRSYVEAL